MNGRSHATTSDSSAPAGRQPASAVSAAGAGRRGWLTAACFWSYLVLLTVATHVPHVNPAYFATVGKVSPLQADKTLHLAAYGMLGVLAGVAFAKGLTGAAVIRLFVALACWGFIDESTQPLFGRSADVWDWCFDVTGLAIGLACVVAVHRRRPAGHLAATGPLTRRSP